MDEFSDYALLAFCLLDGFALSILFDLLRLPLALGGKLFTACIDLFFGAAAFILTAAALFYGARWRVPAYSLIAAGFAFWLWQKLPGRLLREVFPKLCRAKRRRENI